MISRLLTPAETAAPIVFHDRFAAFDGDAIAFWESLTPPDRDLVDQLVRAVVDAVAAPAQDDPVCPRRCDVATRPESAGRPGRFVCTSCGSEFDWPPVPAVVERARRDVH